MALSNFKDWFFSQESSAATRSRNAAFWGTGPKIASPFSHSTPHPGMVDKLLSDIDDDNTEDDDKKKDKKKKKKEKVDETNKGKAPDYSFDAFVQKMSKAKGEIDKEIADAEEKEAEMDRDFDRKSKDRTISGGKEKDTKEPSTKKPESKKKEPEPKKESEGGEDDNPQKRPVGSSRVARKS